MVASWQVLPLLDRGNKIMRIFIMLFIAFLIISIQTFAQNINVSNNSHLPELSQQGHLVSIQITRGNPIKIFVVGREEARLDLTKLELVVWRLSPERQKLHIEKEGNYFTLDPAIMGNSKDLEIH